MYTEVEDEGNVNVQKMIEFITPCKCSGTSQYVHAKCLEEWCFPLNQPPRLVCSVRNTPFRQRRYSMFQMFTLFLWWMKIIFLYFPLVIVRILLFQDMIYSRFTCSALAIVLYRSMFIPLSSLSLMELSVALEISFLGHLFCEVFYETFLHTRILYQENPGTLPLVLKYSDHFTTPEERVVFQSLLNPVSLQMSIWSPDLYSGPEFIHVEMHPFTLDILTGRPQHPYSVYCASSHLKFLMKKLMYQYRHGFFISLCKILKIMLLAFWCNFTAKLENPFHLLPKYWKDLKNCALKIAKGARDPECFHSTFY